MEEDPALGWPRASLLRPLTLVRLVSFSSSDASVRFRPGGEEALVVALRICLYTQSGACVMRAYVAGVTEVLRNSATDEVADFQVPPVKREPL